MFILSKLFRKCCKTTVIQSTYNEVGRVGELGSLHDWEEKGPPTTET